MPALPNNIALEDSDDHLDMRDFQRIATLIGAEVGIKLPPAKRLMVEGRLRRRLRHLHLNSFAQYGDYLFRQDGLNRELPYLINAVTTNKTDFFREPNHFDYMREVALPTLQEKGVRRIRAWSSACSIGAEPYTIAMVLEDFRKEAGGPDYSILATDLSTEVLEKARRGIFPAEMIDPVPKEMARRFVMQAKDATRRVVRIAPQLRAKVGFMRLNLMDATYGVGEPMHMIFCRNVLIYFDKKTQLHVMTRLCECLKPGGYLFIGHSESISAMNLPVRQLANTVFIKE